MTPSIPSRTLNLINREVRNFLREFRQGNASALARFSCLNLLPHTSNPRLADAQHMVAREYGYASWSKLKQHLEAVARDSDTLEELVGL